MWEGGEGRRQSYVMDERESGVVRIIDTTGCDGIIYMGLEDSPINILSVRNLIKIKISFTTIMGIVVQL